MEKKFNDKKNFSEVFLRNVIVGFLGFLQGKFNIITSSNENGKKSINVPVYYSFTGKNRYILDAFYDDIPDKRVQSNTDQIPRATIKLDSWNIKNDEFTNPNVWVEVEKVLNDEIFEFATQLKAVPIKLNFNLEIIVENEIDIFKLWEEYMKTIWIYKYFNFTYHRIPIQAVFNFIGDTDNEFVRDFNFGDANVNRFKMNYSFEVHTFFPLFDINRNNIKEYNNKSNYAMGTIIDFNGQLYIANTNINANDKLPGESDFWEKTSIDESIAMLSNKKVNFILNMWQNDTRLDNN